MTYDELIKSAPVVLVEFYATWCPHCKRMMPIVEQVKELVSGKAEIFQLDIDDNQDASNEASVESVPTFLLYSDGKLLWRQSGEIDGEVLLGKIQDAVG